MSKLPLPTEHQQPPPVSVSSPSHLQVTAPLSVTLSVPSPQQVIPAFDVASVTTSDFEIPQLPTPIFITPFSEENNSLSSIPTNNMYSPWAENSHEMEANTYI